MGNGFHFSILSLEFGISQAMSLLLVVLAVALALALAHVMGKMRPLAGVSLLNKAILKPTANHCRKRCPVI